jgi:hypothetical protein
MTSTRSIGKNFSKRTYTNDDSQFMQLSSSVKLDLNVSNCCQKNLKFMVTRDLKQAIFILFYFPLSKAFRVE